MSIKQKFAKKSTIYCTIVALVIIMAGTGLANGSLETAQAEISYDGDIAFITIDYLVLPEGANEIPLEALTIEGTSIQEVKAFDAAGDQLDLLENEVTTEKWTGAIELAEGKSASEPAKITISYQVAKALTETANKGDINIPIVTPTWPPEQAAPGVFVSNMTLPAGYKYVDGFPVAPEIEKETGRNFNVIHRAQVVPAFIKAQGTSGKVPLLTYPTKVGLTIAALAILGGLLIFSRARRNRLSAI